VNRHRLAFLLSTVALTATIAVSAVHASDVANSGSTATSLRQLAGVNFVSGCGFSHRGPDDPIVFPGQPGRSHDHSFVGSVSTNAYSTLSTLQHSATTCRRLGDTAGYWMPTLLVDSQPTTPTMATIYYRRSTLAAPHAFPSGLKIVAGSSLAVANQDTRIVFWNCGVDGGVKPSSLPPTCANTTTDALRLHVTFPSCWDGRHLDSLDHKSHMAYPARGVCPADHPVPTPQITLIYRYPTTGGPLTALASGSALTGHADFFNAWNQDELNRLVTTCLDALRHCGRGN
jgi:hypothetical protein